jgi:pyruvate-formate lyase-activating enzyme
LISRARLADVSFTLEDGTQIVYFYGEQSIVSTESSAVSTDDQSFLDVVTSNIEIVASKSLIVIVLLLVMPSLFDEPVSMKKVFVFSSSSPSSLPSPPLSPPPVTAT